MRLKTLFVAIVCCLSFNLSFVQAENETPTVNETMDLSHEVFLHFRGASTANLNLTVPGPGYTVVAVYFKGQQRTDYTTANSGVILPITKSSVSQEIQTGQPAAATVYATEGRQTVVINYNVYCYEQ